MGSGAMCKYTLVPNLVILKFFCVVIKGLKNVNAL